MRLARPAHSPHLFTKTTRHATLSVTMHDQCAQRKILLVSVRCHSILVPASFGKLDVIKRRTRNWFCDIKPFQTTGSGLKENIKCYVKLMRTRMPCTVVPCNGNIWPHNQNQSERNSVFIRYAVYFSFFSNETKSEEHAWMDLLSRTTSGTWILDRQGGNTCMQGGGCCMLAPGQGWSHPFSSPPPVSLQDGDLP